MCGMRDVTSRGLWGACTFFDETGALFGGGRTFFLHTLFTTTMSTNREVAETQDNGKSHGPRTTHLRYAFRKAAIILSCFRNGRAFQ